ACPDASTRGPGPQVPAMHAAPWQSRPLVPQWSGSFCGFVAASAAESSGDVETIIAASSMTPASSTGTLASKVVEGSTALSAPASKVDGPAFVSSVDPPHADPTESPRNARRC